MKNTFRLNFSLTSQLLTALVLSILFVFTSKTPAQPRDAFALGGISTQKNSLLADGEIDPSFNSFVTEGTGYVYKTIAQPDGKILTVGLFQRVNGVRTGGIGRLNPDGTLDASFNSGGSGANGAIVTAVLQPDGKILIAGAFTSFNNQPAGRIARLNPDGSIDSSFALTTSIGPQINDISLQPDGKILVGGVFNVSSSSLIRLNSDGTLDTGFSAAVDNWVQTVVYLPSGKIMVGGSFNLPRAKIARLNNDGSLDNSFAIPADAFISSVSSLLVQPDGKIIVGGGVTRFNGVLGDGLVRLNDNGTLDRTLDVPSNSFYTKNDAIALQPDGRILAGYSYSNSNGEFSGVVRFNNDGTLDQSFTAGSVDSLSITDINVLADGKILVSGGFVSYNNQTHFRLIKMSAEGVVDSNFNPLISALGSVLAIKRQVDGKIIIGGDFKFVNGVRKNNLARLNPDGTVDTSFDIGTGVFGIVYTLLVQPDGKIVIGGDYSYFNNVPAHSLARINPDGSFDLNLNSSSGGLQVFAVVALAIQPDGKLLVGGYITNNNLIQVGVTRITADGIRDTTFNSALTGGVVYAIVIQPGGRIVVGGAGLMPRNGIARLNSDGSLDASGFIAGSGNVYALAQQSDGKIYAGGTNLTRYTSDGAFDTTFNSGIGSGTSVRAIERQANGKILIAGLIPAYQNVAVNNIARVNLDGSLDSTFNPGAGASGVIYDLELQPDGKLIASGKFADFDNTEKFSLVRLQNSTQSRQTSFDFDGDGKSDVSVFRPANGVWYLQNSAQGFSATQFCVTNDLIAPADFDGDGKTDVAVFRPSTGVWYVLRSSNNSVFTVRFGQSGDLPRPGDFDGDGKADIALFRPSDGNWYRLNSSNSQYVVVNFGQNGDAPLVGDFDGDGKTDVTVFRPANGTWYRLNSSDGQFNAAHFGQSGDVPSPADYDGDGQSDLAVYRPSTGVWYQLRSSTGQFVATTFGIPQDIPTAADYDGDGRADISVFRPSNGVWYRLNSADSSFFTRQFGQSGDNPAPAAFLQ